MKRINPYKLFVGAFTPNWLLRRPEVSPGAKLCYARLGQYAGEKGIAHPSQEVLAQELGVQERQARRYLAELERWKLIGEERVGKRRTNRYFFFWHAWMETDDPDGDRSDVSAHPDDDRSDVSGHDGDRSDMSGGDRSDMSAPVVRESSVRESVTTSSLLPPPPAEVLVDERAAAEEEEEGRHVHTRVQDAVKALHRCWWPLADDTPRNGELWDSLIDLVESSKALPFRHALQRVNAYYVSKPTRRPTTWQEASSAMRSGLLHEIDRAQRGGGRRTHAS